MLKRVCLKVKSNIGESLVETLIAMLVATFSMMILAGAIVSTLKSSRGGSELDTALSTVDEEGEDIGIQDVGESVIQIGDREVSVVIKSSGKGQLYYYEENAE